MYGHPRPCQASVESREARLGTPRPSGRGPDIASRRLGGGAKALGPRRGDAVGCPTQAEAQESIELVVGLTAGGDATDSFREQGLEVELERHASVGGHGRAAQYSRNAAPRRVTTVEVGSGQSGSPR